MQKVSLNAKEAFWRCKNLELRVHLILTHPTNIVAMKLKFDWIKFSGFFQTLDLGRVQEKDKNLKSLQEILETYAAYMIIIGARKMDKS